MTMIKKQINTQFNKKIPIVPEIIECYIESIEGFKINPYSCTSFMILCGAYPCVCVCISLQSICSQGYFYHMFHQLARACMDHSYQMTPSMFFPSFDSAIRTTFHFR